MMQSSCAEHLQHAGHARLDAGLDVDGLGVAADGAALGRQTVEVPHLAAEQVDQRDLGRAAEVEAAAHLGGGRADPGDQRTTRAGELEEDDRRERLGHVEDARAQHRHRPRRAHEDHRQDEDRHAGAGESDARLGHGAVVHQRRDRAVDDGVDRSLLDRAPPRWLSSDLEQRRHQVGRAHLVLHVLAAGHERDRRHVEARRRPDRSRAGRPTATRSRSRGARRRGAWRRAGPPPSPRGARR